MTIAFDFDAPAPVPAVPTLRQLTERFGNERDAEMRVAFTERSRALCEDLVFPESAPLERIYATENEWEDGYYGDGGGVTFCADEPVPMAVALCNQPGFWASKLQDMGEMRLLAARSFIELARRSGIEHEAVKPTGTDSNGQRTYDMDAVTRLANLMRGRAESLKPELKTPADWQAAIEGVKAWKLAQQGGKP